MGRRRERMDIICESDSGHVAPQLLDPTVSERKEGPQAGLVLCRRATSGSLLFGARSLTHCKGD